MLPTPTAARTPGRQNDQPMPQIDQKNEDFEEIARPSWKLVEVPTLPVPNDSIVSSISGGTANNSANHQQPLETPKPQTKRLNRKLSLQPFAQMAELDSEDENDTAANVTAPVNSAEMTKLMEYIDKKFEKLEAAFNNNK